MIPLDVLKFNSLFSLLYKIDLQFAEQTKAKHCPFAGGHCIMPTTRESLEVALLICQRFLRCDSVCAALFHHVVAESCHLRSDFGNERYIGRPFCSLLPPFAREETRMPLLSNSIDFAAYGAPLSSAGKNISGIFFPKASTTGDYPDGLCPRSSRTSCPGHCWSVLPRSSQTPWKPWLHACRRSPQRHDH